MQLSEKKQKLVFESSKQLNEIGINHTIDACGTITIQTKQGKVIYYPTKEKIQYKGVVTEGGLNNVKNLVESLGLSREAILKNNKSDEMTLRDYFAAQALTALLINTNLLPIIDEGWSISLAKEAYKMADGMMNERENNND
ncbi:hypothetical protein [Xenorhabdus griffiniae]|uniref:Uncharacterized protein n=1 Tax=Xenorhabdus griffiniae TaxID=351672 RepID=A0ABY9XKU3_9GAMM|nr:hypothetical protein [Xenorhabdus griffiniae]MBD1229615.1 hypothetical protein [Xenorhabdus griffiniae]MBE8589441.1 hypothetical protein [Xenorhabdus griffiniae]WMV73496.1 hypothetical protein QL128_05595 [Xenorhabdus griffiniae]WNH03176.1 hypothetical protein QL112_005600 [Xenorhabdus griffiniae]